MDDYTWTDHTTTDPNLGDLGDLVRRKQTQEEIRRMKEATFQPYQPIIPSTQPIFQQSNIDVDQLKGDVAILKDSLNAISQDLHKIKKLLLPNEISTPNIDEAVKEEVNRILGKSEERLKDAFGGVSITPAQAFNITPGSMLTVDGTPGGIEVKPRLSQKIKKFLGGKDQSQKDV